MGQDHDIRKLPAHVLNILNTELFMHLTASGPADHLIVELVWKTHSRLSCRKDDLLAGLTRNVAGQIFIEIDHLNGTASLLTPAPSTARVEGDEDRLFVARFSRADAAQVRERIEREVKFDPDLWVLSLEMRGDDAGVTLVG